MMKKLVSIIAFLSLLMPCEREEPLQEPTIVYDMDTTSTSTEFSYVADLSLENREAYQAFLNDGEIRLLQTFSNRGNAAHYVGFSGRTSYGCIKCNY
ncbi:hypothetical protein NY607_00300 [Lysinibacillus sp. A4]|uniref:hypothetical protein n=1 Tax=Lysinibacillus sp. A4 TaxID=2976269 RepID=UPI0021760383|nr:hypothetical protein [Lysinibacillus sp. A4]MCS5499539.1 hypothetical protein [Lysinibacillus sp. A4]